LVQLLASQIIDPSCPKSSFRFPRAPHVAGQMLNPISQFFS